MSKLSIFSLVQPLFWRIAVLGLSLPLAIASLPAQALPEAEIITRLQKIPVFTITNQTGNFLQQKAGASGNGLSTPVFMELKDAVAFLKRLKQGQPASVKVAQITIVPLSEIYKLQVESKKKAENMSFVFVPTEQQLKNAATVQKKTYQKNAPAMVPLFVIAIEQKDQVVTIQVNKLTSLFLDQKEAQQSLALFKKTEPKLAAQAKIKVYYLQRVLDDFTERNYPGQEQLVLVPSPESRASVRKLQAAQAQSTKTPATSAPKK
jgi:Tic22-like family